MLPIGNWRFEENTIVERTPTTYKNGDPFALIQENEWRSRNPIFIELHDGSHLLAYPVSGYVCPEIKTLIGNTQLNQRNFIVADRYAEHPSIYDVSGLPLINEDLVVNWVDLDFTAPFMGKSRA